MGDTGECLNAAIALLENTAILVENFQSNKPYRSTQDPRFEENRKVLKFFEQWENEIYAGAKQYDDFSKSEQNRCLMSKETRDDLRSMVTCFEQYCSDKFTRHSNVSINVKLMNTDVAENIFCQQRSMCNGGSTHPTLLQYRKSLNTIILCQPTYSPKSNAGKSKVFTEPMAFSTGKPLRV